jgi:hypothetical protein
LPRTFLHTFIPPSASPVKGRHVTLTVSEIEDAGIREVLQTPGAAFGAWSLLDSLLEPTGPGTQFVFKSALGQAREVKVALSGLFGRFVARAYLERYFNLNIFAHLGRRSISLDGRRRIEIERLQPGDLPDWIACAADFSALTVAEAKGCHDPGGPHKALGRAWTQVRRVDLKVGRQRVPVKRIAIATRWAATGSPLGSPHLAVRDPVDEGDKIEPEDSDALFVALLRMHVANLIAPLGHEDLALSLRRINGANSPNSSDQSRSRAREIIGRSPVGEVVDSGIDGLIGGVVTRAGSITEAGISPLDQEALARLNLRPVFVGVERELVRAIIEDEVAPVRKALAEATRKDDVARSDNAGSWIVPLGSGQRLVSGT